MNLVQMALDALEEGEHMLFTAIYGAQGIKLAPRKKDEAAGPKLATSDQVHAFLRQAGAIHEAKGARKAAAQRRGAPQPGKPPPRPSRPSQPAK